MGKIEIRYVKKAHGNFIVNWIGTRQEIVVLPGVMRKVVGTDPRAVFGRWFITEDQAEQIGFVVHKGAVAV